jgi:hypothetical protein
MPILYTNKNINNMLTYKDVTQEQLDAMKMHHKKYRYTESEAVEVFNLVRLFVDARQATCMSCHTNLRDAKTKLNSFLLANESLIEENLLAQSQAIAYVEEPKVVVEELKVVAIAPKKRGRKPKAK